MAKKAQIAYRGNSLLDKGVPVIEKALAEVGYEVETQRWEAGTEKAVMAAWAQQNRADLTSLDLVLSDGTFKYSLPDELERNLHFPKKQGKEDEEDLDNFIERILFDEVVGKERKSRKDDELAGVRELGKAGELEQYRQAYLRVLSKMQLPKRVYVITEMMSSHGPFYEPDKERTPEGDKKSAETFAGWLREAGIAEVIIADLWRLPKDDRNQEHWCVYDRHVKSCMLNYRDINGYVNLQVPFGNFWEDVTKLGLIQSVDYSEKLAEYVKQRFGEGK